MTIEKGVIIDFSASKHSLKYNKWIINERVFVPWYTKALCLVIINLSINSIPSDTKYYDIKLIKFVIDSKHEYEACVKLL